MMKVKGKRQKVKGWGMVILSACVVLPSSFAFAAPTADEVFKSVDDTMFTTVDPDKLLAAGIAVLAVAGIVIALSFARKRSLNPRPLNSPSKLVKEIAKEMNLKNTEVRQLRTLSERLKLISPLVLLLCPSLLTRAVRENPELADRGILTRLAQKTVAKDA